MKTVLSRENCKISIGGIKFSEKLTHVSLEKKTTDDSSINELLYLLAQKRINIPFLCHSSTTYPNHRSCFCINHENFPHVQSLLNFTSFANLNIEIIQSVGTITLFPHKNSFHLLGKIIQTFAKFDLPVYSMSSSISAIALNTDFLSLDMVAEKLQEIASLPKNHAPFRQEFCLKELQQ